MQNLETYVTKIFEKAKQFLQKDFPEEYVNPKIKIKVEHMYRPWILQDYVIGYDYKKKEILLTSYEEKKEVKSNDLITNFFRLKMKRKNTYLISIIHELFESQYLNEALDKHFYVSNYDLTISHERVMELELKVLDKLIEQNRGQDKQEFIKRKEAREKELKERKKVFKIRGV